MAEGASKVSLNGLRSMRGISATILLSSVMSLLLELNSTAAGVSVMVTVVCTEPVFSIGLTVTSPPACTSTFS